MDFRRGERVEVSLTEEGFAGSYYAATLLARVGNDDLLVEYKTLCAEDGTRMLREIVSRSIVRLSPPEIVVSDFSVLDKVDAYDNDGWWVGTILAKNESGYCVYFDTNDEQATYPFSELRVHQEWEDGKWVVSHIRALK